MIAQLHDKSRLKSEEAESYEALRLFDGTGVQG